MSYSNNNDQKLAAASCPQVYADGAESPKREPRVRSAHDVPLKAQEETRYLLGQLEDRLSPALAPPRPQQEQQGVGQETSGPRVELESAFYEAATRQHGFNERLSELLARLEI